MTDARDSEGYLLPDNRRSFPLGTFLRHYSLDELPQLFNIVKGDMSLVGPRPWIPEQLAVFPERYRTERCSVRPGLTGMAQEYGRNPQGCPAVQGRFPEYHGQYPDQERSFRACGVSVRTGGILTCPYPVV